MKTEDRLAVQQPTAGNGYVARPSSEHHMELTTSSHNWFPIDFFYSSFRFQVKLSRKHRQSAYTAPLHTHGLPRQQPPPPEWYLIN